MAGNRDSGDELEPTVEKKQHLDQKDLDIVFQFQRKMKRGVEMAEVLRFMDSFDSQLDSSEWAIRLTLKCNNLPGSKMERIKRARWMANGPVLRVPAHKIHGQADVKKQWLRPCSKMTIREFIKDGVIDISNIRVSPSIKKSKFGVNTIRPHEVDIQLAMMEPTMRATRCRHRVCDFDEIIKQVEKVRSYRSIVNKNTYVTGVPTNLQSDFIMEFGGPNKPNAKDFIKLLLGNESENAVSFGFGLGTEKQNDLNKTTERVMSTVEKELLLSVERNVTSVIATFGKTQPNKRTKKAINAVIAQFKNRMTRMTEEISEELKVQGHPTFLQYLAERQRNKMDSKK